MRITHNLLLVTVVAAGLAAPSVASAQAIPRSSPPSTGSSSSSSSGSSSGSTGSMSVPDSPPARSAPPPRSSPSGGSGSSGTRGGSSAVQRTGGSGGGSSRVLADPPSYVGLGSRDRGGRSILGTAVPRSASPITGWDNNVLRWSSYPFSPWGRWYPWYAGGWGYGIVTYDPWRFGGTRWIWGRYGTWWYEPSPWYDPWYDPYYGWYGGWYGGGGSDWGNDDMGSLRIKVNPSKAQVYIDGVLQGVVDDFDGLTHHLDVPSGTHQLEIRANGYTTLKDSVTLEPGRTLTYRGSLKKSSK